MNFFSRQSILLLLIEFLSLISVHAWTVHLRYPLRRGLLSSKSSPTSPQQVLVLCSSKKHGNEKTTANAQPKSRLFAQDSVLKQTKKHTSTSQQHSSFKSDSSVTSLHQQRIRTAGREGSITFIDPCRVFFGNLDLTVTSEDLCEFVARHHGLPSTFLIVDAEVITDWRTGVSKGYGFVRYTEPVYATNALDTCHGKLWNGRRLSVKPAVNSNKQKEVERQREMYEQRKLKRELAKANGEDVKQVTRPNSMIPTDPRGLAFLRSLDPGLVDDVKVQSEEIDEDEGDSNVKKNRQQRRKEERAKPKKKPVSKGFGS